MIFTIEQKGTKRKLDGGFTICASRADFLRLAEFITTRLDTDDQFSYGWIEIPDRVEKTPDLSAKAWDD